MPTDNLGRRKLESVREDVARSAYQTGGDRFAAFREYLAWEVGLVAQLDQDGTADFRLFPTA